MITRQISYQILFWAFITIIAGHVFCPVLQIDKHWIHWITLVIACVGLAVVVFLRGWIHATEVECTIDPLTQKLLIVRLNPARIALLDESFKIVECSNAFADEVGARSSYDLVGRDAGEFLNDPAGQVDYLKQALNDFTRRPISFLGLDSLQRQVFIKVAKLNQEYLVSLDPMKA